MMNSTDFTGFVLAGGKSSRMGTPKHALEVGGETFLTCAVNALKPVCQSVKIVLNQTQTIETDLPVVRDIYAERGALGGIHAALKNCETKFAVILAVDLPFVTSEAIKKIQEIALASNKLPAAVARQADGKVQPLCGVYRAKYCLPPLEKILEENDKASVRDFLDTIFPKLIEAEQLSADENLLFNVNFPADFQQIG